MGSDRTSDGSPSLAGPFFALVVAQAAHSVEEYRGRLFEVFPPARFVSGLLSDDLERGFVVANLALFSLGLICLLGPVLQGWRSGRVIAGLWAALESLNATGHLGWSLLERRYTPGLATAPFLLLCSLWIARRLASTPAAPASS